MPGANLVAAVLGGSRSTTQKTALLPTIDTGPQFPEGNGPNSASTVVPQSYGSTTTTTHASPERTRRDNSSPLNRVPEDGSMIFDSSEDVGDLFPGGENEEDLELQEELALEQEGFYKGSYKNLVFLYTLVPLTSVISLVLFSLLPSLAYRTDHDPSPYPYSSYLPFPLPELFTSASLWCLAYLLRDPIYTLSSLLLPEKPSIFLSAFLDAAIAIFIRLTAMYILLIPQYTSTSYSTWHHGEFVRVWAVGLGWAAAEAVVAVKQGYDGLALYRDIIVPGISFTSRESLLAENESLDQQIERDLDELVALKGREEIEELYGMPFIRIPIFLSVLQRLNSVLLSLGVTLMIASVQILPIVLAFIVQLSSSTLHTSLLLPKLGVHTVVYVGLLVALGTFFAGLGMWDVLT